MLTYSEAAAERLVPVNVEGSKLPLPWQGKGPGLGLIVGGTLG